MAFAGEQLTTSFYPNREVLGVAAIESAAEPTPEQTSLLRAIQNDISIPPKEVPEYISPHAARAACLIQAREPERLRWSVRTCLNKTLEVWDIGSVPVGTDEPFTVLPVPETFRSSVALHLINWYTYAQYRFVREGCQDICRLQFPDREAVEVTPDDTLVLRAMVSAMADFDQPEPLALDRSQALSSLLWRVK